MSREPRLSPGHSTNSRDASTMGPPWAWCLPGMESCCEYRRNDDQRILPMYAEIEYGNAPGEKHAKYHDLAVTKREPTF